MIAPRIARCTAADLGAWAALRVALWPDADAEGDHSAEAAALLAGEETPAFLCRGPTGVALGFAEASLRRDYVNGCDTSPVGFVEGLYVVPAARGRGIGRALVANIAGWARSRGCAELASDAPLDNAASHGFHAALGFAETERVVYFRRTLG